MSFFRFNRANQLVQIKCSKLFEKFLKWVSFEGFFFLVLLIMQLPMIFCFHVFFYIYTERKNDILLPPKETKYGDKGFVKE